MIFSDNQPVVLVTGVSGFIGGFVAQCLVDNGFSVVGTCRRRSRLNPRLERVCSRIHELEIDSGTDWSAVLQGVHFVVHTAAHVHVRRPKKHDEDLFRLVNVDGLRRLAIQSCAASIKLFVNLSSIAAQLESPTFHSTAYGESKRKGEMAIAEVFGDSRSRFINLRLPAVYGPGMRGGLKWLSSAVTVGLPFPIIESAPDRSYLSVWNLADCILHCLLSVGSSALTVSIADREPLDLLSLARLIATANDKKLRSIRLSSRALALVLTIAGLRREYERAMMPITIDAREAERILGWSAPISAAESWRRVAIEA
jgi:nucleoside-diphosphate-sugar epimerase